MAASQMLLPQAVHASQVATSDWVSWVTYMTSMVPTRHNVEATYNQCAMGDAVVNSFRLNRVINEGTLRTHQTPAPKPSTC